MKMNNKNTQEKYCLFCGKSFRAERSTKKYCGDVCKHLAFYQRNGPVSLPLSDTDIVTLTGKGEDHQNDTLAIVANNLQPIEPLTLALNGKPAACEVPTLIIPATCNTTSSIPLPVSDNYQPVLSELIEAIAVAVEEDQERYRIATCPKEYWQGDTLAAVVWTNTRLRCLLENLLWLSRHKQIERKAFNLIRHAFNAMLRSNCFKRLPVNYPYTVLLKELEQQCNTIAAQQNKKVGFHLQLTVKRKVEFIATRFLLAASVPKVKFSELNFEN